MQQCAFCDGACAVVLFIAAKAVMIKTHCCYLALQMRPRVLPNHAYAFYFEKHQIYRVYASMRRGLAVCDACK
jgi:hypothetical protein